MVLLRVVFILVILGSNLVLSMNILQDSSDNRVKKKDGYRLFKRQVECLAGEYPGEVHCCKNCGKGTYAASECKNPHGNPDCRPCIEGVDFMDKENGYPKCQKCQHCESASGQEMLHPCTLSRDTVCRCKENFFCSDSLSSPNENCNKCLHCTECDNGIAEECSPIQDTVCYSHARYHQILWPVIVVFIVAVSVMGFLVYRMKKSKTEQSTLEESLTVKDRKPQCPPHLENIELDNHLYDISGIMEYESVQKLAMKKITPVEREEIKRNNQTNAREEKFELLRKWYYANGRQGAFKILIEYSNKGEAAKIIDLVKA